MEKPVEEEKITQGLSANCSPQHSTATTRVGDHPSDTDSVVIVNDVPRSSFPPSNKDSVECNELPAQVPQNLTNFIVKLYENPQITKYLYTNSMPHTTFEFFRNNALPTSPSLAAIENKLMAANSHAKRLKILEVEGLLISPTEHVLGTRQELTMREGRTCLRPLTCTAYSISIVNTFKRFFSMKNVLIDTLTHVNNLVARPRPEVITHFVEGSVWKSRLALHPNKTVLPFFLFVDDHQPPNDLGSHSCKIGAAYVSLPCLPPMYVSELSRMFLVLLYHIDDRTTLGNSVIFQPIVDEINVLIREGINFDVPGFKGTVYFDLGALFGDNLGVVDSFSCRTCTVDKTTMATQIYEDPLLLRNKENYESDLEMDTGIKDKCIWLQIDNFDFEQIAVDPMRDLSEGVLRDCLSLMLLTLIEEKKFFSIEFLNNKIRCFDYGPDSSNKPVPLDINDLHNGLMSLSATQMEILVLYLGVMIGDMIPRLDYCWEIYAYLWQSLDLMMEDIFYMPRFHFLRDLISGVCETYKEHSKVNLNLNLHHFLHYPPAFEKFGPICHLSSLRFEGNHRKMKLASKAASNRVNLKTLADNNQLSMVGLFSVNELPSPITSSRSHTVPPNAQFLAGKFDCKADDIKLVSLAQRGGERYCKDTVLVYEQGEMDLTFFSVHNVFLTHDSSRIQFSGCLLPPYEDCGFDPHYHAHEVELPNNTVDVKYVCLDSLPSPVPCNQTAIDHAIPPRSLITLRKPVG